MPIQESPRPSDSLSPLPFSQNYAPFISKSKRFNEKSSPKQAQQRYSILPEINMDTYHPKNSRLRHSTQENKISMSVFTSKVDRFLLPQNGVPGPAFYPHNQGQSQSQSLHHSPTSTKFFKVLTRASPSIPDIRNKYGFSSIENSHKLEFKDGKHVEQQRRLMREYLQNLDKTPKDTRLSKGQEREEIYKQKQKILEKVQAAFKGIQTVNVEEKENKVLKKIQESARKFRRLNKSEKREPQYAVVYRKWPRTHQSDKIDKKIHVRHIEKTKFQFFGTSQIRFKREVNHKPLKIQQVFLPLHVLSKY